LTNAGCRVLTGSERRGVVNKQKKKRKGQAKEEGKRVSSYAVGKQSRGQLTIPWWTVPGSTPDKTQGKKRLKAEKTPYWGVVDLPNARLSVETRVDIKGRGQKLNNNTEGKMMMSERCC